MARRILALCALLLCGCECETKAKRHEEIPAAVKTPIEASVRVFGVEVPEPCTLTGLQRPLCLFEHQTVFDGCSYLEVGPHTEVSATTPSDVEAVCARASEASAHLSPLPEVTPSTAVQLEADPAGDRLALRVDGAEVWTIFHLDRGELIGSSSFSTHALDWSKVPTFDQAAGELTLSATQGVERVFLVLEQRYGVQAKRRQLEAMIADDVPIDPVLEQLDDDEKASLRRLLARELEVAPTTVGLERYVLLGGKPDASLLGAWVETLESAGLEDVDLAYEYEEQLRTLIDTRHPRAGELSCRLLGAMVLGGPESELGYDPVMGGEPMVQTALAGVALGKTPCPWVTELLLRFPCLPELRCAPDGRSLWEVTEGPLDDEDDEAYDPEADEKLLEQSERFPLCTAAQTTKQLDRWKDWIDFGSSGPVLLAAAYEQGPLPASVVLRNQRRTYRVITPRRHPSTPGGEDEDPDADAPCERLQEALPSYLCQTPPEAQTIAAGNCELRFDDAARTVTLKALSKKSAGASTPLDGP